MDTRKKDIKNISQTSVHNRSIDVLDKTLFSNIFEKDIKRVYIYKKAERIAQAVHLLGPAFTTRTKLGERLDTLALSLIEAALAPTHAARRAISEHLLELSSLLAVAASARLLSPMNVEILSREIESLLVDVSLYEEPKLSLPQAPSLAQVFSEQRSFEGEKRSSATRLLEEKAVRKDGGARGEKGGGISKRQSEILRIIKDKREVEIKDISSILHEISEKTIQRELLALVASGVLEKRGERRWSRYSLMAA